MLGLRSMFSKLVTAPRVLYQPMQFIHVSQVDLRARKGTRERKEKIKKKNKAEKAARIAKIGAIPLYKRSGKVIDKHLTTDWKALPMDDAYPGRYYRWPLYKTVDAIEGHKATHHPTVYDAMDSPLNVAIEMNMIGDKPTRLVSNFQKLVSIKYPFDHGQERTILVFAKEEENRSDAIRAGATTVGGSDLVKTALKGNVRFSEYQYILAHPDIMPEMLALRGLLKARFPSAKGETLSVDLFSMVKKFLSGLIIHGKRDEMQENFGLVNTCIGNLKMPTDELASNFNDIMTTINGQRPNRGGKFITRVLFTSPPSKEIFRIDPADFPFEDYERPEVEKKGPPKKRSKNEPVKFERSYQLFRTPILVSN